MTSRFKDKINQEFKNKVIYIIPQNKLNLKFFEQSNVMKNLVINDINLLAAKIGIDKWYDDSFYFNYKYALGHEAIPVLSHSILKIIISIIGKSKKKTGGRRCLAPNSQEYLFLRLVNFMRHKGCLLYITKELETNHTCHDCKMTCIQQQLK